MTVTLVEEKEEMGTPLAVDPIDHPQAEPHPFTVETLLWVLLGMAALFLRLFDLGRWPLSEQEAALALEAWHFVSGQPYTLTGAGGALSPLAFNLDALLFTLVGPGDSVARVAQALAGTALVLAPWSLRPLLGRGAALGTSALLLLSPTTLFFSRHASGEIWAALCSLLLLTASARWLQRRHRQDGWLAALALGVGLSSGAGFWSLLLSGALLALWIRWREQRVPVALAPSEWREYGALALGTFLLSATGFFTNLPGLGAALSLPLAWLQQLFLGPPLILPFFFVFLLYEFFVVLASLLGSALLGEEVYPWVRFTLLWTAVTALPATLSNSGWTAGMLFIVLPLSILGGVALLRGVQAFAEMEHPLVERLSLATGLFLVATFWVTLVLYMASALQSTPSSDWFYVIRLFVIFALMLVGLVVLNLGYGWGSARRVLGLTLLLVLTIVTLSSSWGLSLVRGADPREPLVVQPGRIDLRAGAAQLAQISTERYRRPHVIPLGIQETVSSAPRWYFRDFTAVEGVAGSHAYLPEAALLEVSEPPPPGYLGQRVWASTSWKRPTFSPPGLLRWLLTREEPQGLVGRAVVLYVELPVQDSD